VACLDDVNAADQAAVAPVEAGSAEQFLPLSVSADAQTAVEGDEPIVRTGWCRGRWRPKAIARRSLPLASALAASQAEWADSQRRAEGVTSRAGRRREVYPDPDGDGARPWDRRRSLACGQQRRVFLRHFRRCLLSNVR